MIYISEFIGTSDIKFDISLPFGTLYKSGDLFYVIGSSPIGNNFTSKIEERIDKRHVFADENDELGFLEDYTYTVITYKSVLSPEEIINKFIDLIKETAVIIKDSEFFLKYPIVTTGIAKVFLDNCVAHLDGKHAGFIKISNTQDGKRLTDEELDSFSDTLKDLLSKATVISNNSVDKFKMKKYGSQNKADYYPVYAEYHIKVNKEDTVINTRTDKRGYPGSCGTDNKNKDVVMIVRGNKERETMTVSELKQMIADAEKRGIKKIEITKQILIDSNEKLSSKLEIRSS